MEDRPYDRIGDAMSHTRIILAIKRIEEYLRNLHLYQAVVFKHNNIEFAFDRYRSRGNCSWRIVVVFKDEEYGEKKTTVLLEAPVKYRLLFLDSIAAPMLAIAKKDAKTQGEEINRIAKKAEEILTNQGIPELKDPRKDDKEVSNEGL